MTVIVTVNVEGRYRGFLASAMLEIAPGVYTSPNMTSGIRERIWDVLAGWYYELGQGSIVMTWRDPGAVSEQEIRSLGESPKEIVDADGVYLVKTVNRLPRTRGDRQPDLAVFADTQAGCPALAGIDRLNER